jgi:hypothetical protein
MFTIRKSCNVSQKLKVTAEILCYSFCYELWLSKCNFSQWKARECAFETASAIEQTLTFREKSNVYLKKFATTSHGYAAVKFKARCTTCQPTTLFSTE